MTADVIMTVDGGVARIAFNRPEARNAVTGQMVQDMAAFCQGIENDPDVRCLLISGAGAHFMAGGDVKSFQGMLEASPEDRARDFEQRSIDAAPLFLALARMPQPVVCSVRGFAAGVALSFVAGADLAIASDNAQFLLAHVGLGLVADGACTWHLPRAIGARRAKQMAFLGDRVGAAEALQMGLVNWVVPDAELEAKTEEIVARLARGPKRAIAEAKRLIDGSASRSCTDQIAEEGRALARCAATGDIVEGVSAFIEKRKAVFADG